MLEYANYNASTDRHQRPPHRSEDRAAHLWIRAYDKGAMGKTHGEDYHTRCADKKVNAPDYRLLDYQKKLNPTVLYDIVNTSRCAQAASCARREQEQLHTAQRHPHPP